jgi:transposase-like protein
MKPEDFERTEGPIQSDEGFVYEGWEARKDAGCPRCASRSCIIKDRYVAEIRLRSDILKTEVLICHRIKYVCKGCGKTFTVPLKGAMVGRSLTHLERAAMLAELDQGDTFERVARAHGVSKTEAVRVFDEAYPEVRRRPLPRILLIDEFKFSTRFSKYCCHLVDFEASESVDVIRSSQKAYLDEYFGRIGESERGRVKVLVTDMYDEYAHLARRWLPNAKVVADRFHVVINFTCGYNSYGPWRQLAGQPRDLFAIIGYWIDPNLGRPRYDASLLFHETNHPFVNPLLDDANNIKLMENVGPRLLSLHKSSVQKTNYTDWRIVVNESLVRASVVLYMQDAGYKMEQCLNVLGAEMGQNGFPWMLDLVGTMRYYTAHRHQYPTLNDFYSEISRCLSNYIDNVK